MVQLQMLHTELISRSCNCWRSSSEGPVLLGKTIVSRAVLLIQTLPGEDERHLLESTFNLVEASDLAACWSSATSATCTAVVHLGQKFFLTDN